MDLLIEMDDYYHLDLRELLDGQRKQMDTNEEIEDTVRKVAEYNNENKLKVMKRMNLLFIGGLCLGIEFGMLIVGIVITSKYASKFMEKKKQ